IDRAEDLIASGDFREIKRGRRTRSGTITTEAGVTIHVKRTAAANWSTGLLHRLSGSRSARALNGAKILESGGFAHPAPLAAPEDEPGPPRSQLRTVPEPRSAPALSVQLSRRASLARRIASYGQ